LHHALTRIVHRPSAVTGESLPVLVEVENRYPIVEEHQHESSFFPWYTLIGFSVLFLPVLVLGHLLLPSAPWFLAGWSALTFSLLLYELVHAIEHWPEQRWHALIARPRTGGFWRKAYAFHLRHHADIRCNEGISGVFGVPIYDLIFGTYVDPNTLFRHGGTDAQKEEHIAGIIGGETRFAFAYSEPKSRFDLNDVSTTAKKDGAGYTLNGHKAVVIGAPFATHLIVTARTSGAQRDANGITVFLVARNAKGVTTRDYPTVDGLRASEVYFENVAVGADAVIGKVDGGLPLVEKVVDNAIAALCAEAVGCFKVLNEATISYAKQRKQFGQSIATFQVLQHRMVDMFMAAEQASSMTYMVTLKLDEADKARKLAASAAKVQIGKAGKLVSQDAVQIHGGMGMTDELNVGHFFKRVTMIESQFGNTDWHLRRYTELSNG
jgi:alkylation response protein AidB-like acyl-CoA dehydrogenase